MRPTGKTLLYYGLGIALSLLCIGFIHLYSYIFETYFCYATGNNIIITALISGFPFGATIWAFKNLKTTK